MKNLNEVIMDGLKKSTKITEADIRKALLVDSFWQDKKELIPSEEKIWCEVWLSSTDEDNIRQFEGLLAEQDIVAADGLIQFPEVASLGVDPVHPVHHFLGGLVSEGFAEFLREPGADEHRRHTG